jgi:hypothetical protein
MASFSPLESALFQIWEKVGLSNQIESMTGHDVRGLILDHLEYLPTDLALLWENLSLKEQNRILCSIFPDNETFQI